MPEVTSPTRDRLVTMCRETMENLPDFAFPPGFHARAFQPGDGPIWTRIQRAAEPFIEIDNGRFGREFGGHLDAMEDRSIFVVTGDGEEVGTITAWWDLDWRGRQWGVIRWLAIHPHYQGRGLSKPTLSAAMRRLRRSYERCYLRTTTGRLAAIKIYLDFGFTPLVDGYDDASAWADVASALDHPILHRR